VPCTWISTQAELVKTVDVLACETLLALDVETAPNFGALCLIQVATVDHVYLIDPFTVGDLAPLDRIFKAESPRKVIHNAKFERKILTAVGLTLNGVVDTIEMSRRRRGVDVFGGHSLDIVCERELGLYLDKSMQVSDWTTRPLSPAQLAYAATDAHLLLLLHDSFSASPLLSHEN
jgi:ATP-dependent helicase Lhr and Lhr-like helicase